ncbi:MAG: YjgN family protein [Hyphomicrobium sp.]
MTTAGSPTFAQPQANLDPSTGSGASRAASPGMAEGDGQELRLSWVPPTGLLGLSFANFALRIVTLGIYNFWAKTEIRRRVWSAVRLDGEPLTYTGTGKELFLGFLVIMLAIFAPLSIVSLLVFYFFGPQSPATVIYQVMVYLFFFFLTGVAIYRAQRYRLSRTTWRGIRGNLSGNGKSYAWLYSWTALLIPLTLGWIMPWRATRLQNEITADTRFGTSAFRFDAQPRPLYGPFTVLWVGGAVIALLAFLTAMGSIYSLAALTLPVDSGPGTQPDPATIVGIIIVIYGVMAVAFLLYYLLSAWYRARQINHFSNHTHFEGASFRSTVTGGGLVWVAIGNFLLRMAGLIFGIVLVAILFSAVALLFGTETLGSLQPPEAGGEPPNVVLQMLIFASIIVTVASAGLFGPIIQSRTARYLVENLSIDGKVPLASIAQGADQGIKRGEGLAQAFDVDAF